MPTWQDCCLRRLFVSCILLAVWYHTPGRAQSSGGSRTSVSVPFGEAALWAVSTIPEHCDAVGTPGTPEIVQGCSVTKLSNAWRYAMNNLRLAVEGASKEDLSWLPVDNVRQLHGAVKQLGHDRALWFGSWGQAAGVARQVATMLADWIKGTPPLSVSMPSAAIGTQFPTMGRSVVVPTTGDMSHAVTLANGFTMPVLGFGTWQLPADGTTYQTVRWALELGYRHIDTAQGYQNEHEVGRAMKDSGLAREQICLVTKLSDPGEYRSARKRFEMQLQIMGVEYIDIYMLHSPGSDAESRKQAWQQMEELYEEGKIKALGLSNFDIELIKELLVYARVRPVYLQNKYSIYQPGSRDEALKGESLMAWLAKEKIVMTGYSIIHPAHGGYLSPMEDPHVISIAQRHGKTPSQVLHRWMLQLGTAVIPRSTKQHRIRENGDLFSFALTEQDMRLLNGIASLLNSVPGTQFPAWCDDVYGVQALA